MELISIHSHCKDHIALTVHKELPLLFLPKFSSPNGMYYYQRIQQELLTQK